jgi:ACS family tartrate transporter-like MFS transporter
MTDERVFAKCAWRLIPFMMLLYVVNYLDRVNVGFAALTMNKDLGFGPAIYGFGAGLFYLGYLLFQVPASVALVRVGARRSIFAILTVWGAISASTALVREPLGFYALRFLLGAAEAGFFPVLLVYLTYWFPRSYRGRFTALFMTAIPLSSVIGGPLSGSILGMQGVAGLAGWQWLFVIEGLPACILGLAVLVLLPEDPAHAAWLSAEEKVVIASRVAEQDPAMERQVWPALRDPRVWALGLVNVALLFSNQGIQLWLPQIVKEMGFSNLAVGFIVALPYLVSLPAMVLWGRSSDLRDERIWHVALPALLAAGGFAVASLAQSDFLSLFAIALAAIGLVMMTPSLFSLISSFLSGPAAAGGIALVISIGNLGSFLGPSLVGVLKEQTGGYAVGMAMFVLPLVLAAAIVLGLGRKLAPRPKAKLDLPPVPGKP